MIGQVALYEVSNKERPVRRLRLRRRQLANQAILPSLNGRWAESLDRGEGDFLILLLSVDPKEAMRTSMLNTARALVSPLEVYPRDEGLMAILST